MTKQEEKKEVSKAEVLYYWVSETKIYYTKLVTSYGN